MHQKQALDFATEVLIVLIGRHVNGENREIKRIIVEVLLSLK